MAKAGLRVGLSRHHAVREETNNARNAGKVEKEEEKYLGIFLPPEPLSASASLWPNLGQKLRESILQKLAPSPNREKATLGKES